MRANKLFKRPKAENGAGRSVKIKHLLLPEEVVKDLRLYKDIYSVCLAKEKDENGDPILVRVTFEQMFRRWMDQVGRFDSDVADKFVQIKKSRMKEQEHMAAGLGITAEQLKENEAAFDPADLVNEPWELRYKFEKNGEEVEAYLGDKAAFYAKMDGRSIGMAAMLKDGWTLMNEVGVNISIEDAWKINKIIKDRPTVSKK